MQVSQASADQIKHHISLHAVQRFRERADRATRPKTDRDLALILDARIQEAIAARQVTDVIDRDDPGVNTKVVRIDNREGPDLHVVMRMFRPSSHAPMKCVAGPAGIALGAVTILTQEMATQAYATGRWFVTEDKKPSSFTEPGFKNDALAAKIATVAPAVPVAAVRAPEDEELSGLGGTRQERTEFLQVWLRRESDSTWVKADQAMKAEFGVGCSMRFYSKVKGEMRPGPAPASAEAPSGGQSVQSVKSIAIQFAQAIEAEKAARTRLAAAQSELTESSRRAASLLEQLQAQRG